MEVLFSKTWLRDSLAKHSDRVTRMAASLPEAQLVQRSDADLADDLISQSGLQVLVIQRDKAESSDPIEGLVSVPDTMSGKARGWRVSFKVPYDGPTEFFDCRPRQYTSNPPSATVDGNGHYLLFEYEQRTADATQLRAMLDRDLATLAIWVDRVNGEVQAAVAGLREQLGRDLAARRTTLATAQTLREDLNR